MRRSQGISAGKASDTPATAGLKGREKLSDSELIPQQKKKTHGFPNSRQGPEQLCEEFQLQTKQFSTLPVANPLEFRDRGARSAHPSPAPGAENATETNPILPAATAALLMCKSSPP